MIREVVKVNKVTVTMKRPMLSCGHSARLVALSSRIKKSYFCASCANKENRKTKKSNGDYFDE